MRRPQASPSAPGSTLARTKWQSRWYCAPGRAHDAPHDRRGPASLRVKRDTWVRLHRPGPPRRRVVHRGRRRRLALAHLARPAALTHRDPLPRAVGRHRRGSAAAAGRGPCADTFEELRARPLRRPVPAWRCSTGSGLDAAVLFPNFGLLWEKMLAEDRARSGPTPGRSTASWRRSAARARGDCSASPISSCTIRPGPSRRSAGSAPPASAWPWSPRPRWTGSPSRIATSTRCGPPAATQGVAPVFHVSGFESPLHPAWRQGELETGESLFDSIFLWLAPAVALADLILHGTLDRFPDLRLGVVELTAGWVPQLPPAHRRRLRLLRPAARRALPASWPLRPSEYFFRQVRVAALPYEMPNRLVPKVGDRHLHGRQRLAPRRGRGRSHGGSRARRRRARWSGPCQSPGRQRRLAAGPVIGDLPSRVGSLGPRLDRELHRWR